MDEPILVIDDNPTFNATLVRTLERRGQAATGALDAGSALTAARRLKPARIVLDLNLAGCSGLALIQEFLAIRPDCRIVVLTGYASIATAVEAIKLGAVQYFAKPVEIDALLSAFAQESRQADDYKAPDRPLSVDRLEWEHIQRVLQENGGNVSATARALNMHRRTLQRKLAKHPASA
jgi:two-component system response regulator RegA